MNAALILADTQINTDTVTPGVLGFIVVAAIGLVLYFLMKSMLGKLREVKGREFGEEAGTGAETGGQESADTLGQGETTEGKTPENNGPS
ncbi:hypothetical protein [Allosalinactinospora lopnorensis]|uniref:hypothetical protein n=1 Tax=Allosalinactinospora lopnorensis TaxID=1352348 RepID=UPI000B07132D|nr:hypothetical protein [Allosalinactinospora lopnorensis]